MNEDETLAALKNVTVHLMAAISLLESTPKAKKAAASETIFNMMINDYKASAEIGRKVLLKDEYRPAYKLDIK